MKPTGASLQPGAATGDPGIRSESLVEAIRLLVPPLSWVLLWAALNAGGIAPSQLVAPEDAGQWIHSIRALFPIGVLMMWGLHVSGRPDMECRLPSRTELLWLGYGAVGIVAGLAGPRPTEAFYWGLCFLAPFVSAEMYLWRGRRLRRARRLNHLTWICTAFVLTMLLFAAGGDLFVGSGLGVSAYNVVVRVSEVMGMPMARSSGLSRMAAVLALVTLVSAVNTSGWKTIPWAVLSTTCAGTLAVMGSEGSLVSFAGAALLVTGFLVSLRKLALVASAVGIFLIVGPDFAMEAVSGWFPDFGALATLQDRAWSGRPDHWRVALGAIERSTALGSGFQADRYLTGLNAQSGFLYVLLTSGIVGGGLYVGGLVVLWRKIWRGLRSRTRLSSPNQTALLQIAGVAAFLTLRHVPENTSALFSVDLLLMLPAIVFAGELVRALEAE